MRIPRLILLISILMLLSLGTPKAANITVTVAANLLAPDNDETAAPFRHTNRNDTFSSLARAESLSDRSHELTSSPTASDIFLIASSTFPSAPIRVPAADVIKPEITLKVDEVTCIVFRRGDDVTGPSSARASSTTWLLNCAFVERRREYPQFPNWVSVRRSFETFSFAKRQTISPSSIFIVSSGQDALTLSASRLDREKCIAMKSSIEGVIKDSYDLMPRQMKVVARWLLDHPIEVPLLSMREQARRVGVPPATLTRLAQRLGFDGFVRLKETFADTIRERPDTFAGRVEELLAGHEADASFIGDTIDALHSHLSDLANPSAIAALATAADLMAEARNIFCLGLRSSFPAAYLVHYVGSMLGSPTVLFEGVGGTPNDTLGSVGPGDVLLAVTVNPYARYTVHAAEFAVSRGAKLVALTDSELSPIGKFAAAVIRVRTETPSFFHTMTPSFAAAECLVELIAAKRGSRALEALEANEAHLAAFDTHVLHKPGRREL